MTQPNLTVNPSVNPVLKSQQAKHVHTLWSTVETGADEDK